MSDNSDPLSTRPAQPVAAPTAVPAAPSAAPGVPDPATLRAAYNAFKKRWKLTRLDAESKLGGGRPVTGGKSSNIAGIEPPREFPRVVWAELAKQGRIKDCRDGFYGMP